MSTPSPAAIHDAIATLRAALGSAPRHGLPEELFLFVSSLTPLVNVDLLIRDAAGRCLLTWRHDDFYGPGWHVPGGIIRFKESAAARIAAVAASELGAEVSCSASPAGVFEITHPSRDVRGHFISLLYLCQLTTSLDETRRFDPLRPRAGDWAWHSTAPANLIAQHDLYRPFIDRPASLNGPRSSS